MGISTRTSGVQMWLDEGKNYVHVHLHLDAETKNLHNIQNLPLKNGLILNLRPGQYREFPMLGLSDTVDKSKR